jgi:uroporphyrinogen-III synthase
MRESKIAILSTRPLSARTINVVADKVNVDEVSFIQTKNIIDASVAKRINEIAQQKAVIVFTSMNAAEAVIHQLKKNQLQPDWGFYCLGGTTRKIIADYFGANKISSVANNANDLAEKIIADKQTSVIFFCGNIRREELPIKFKAHHITAEEIVVYETIETAQFIKKNYDGILFFSPSAVNSFFSVNQLPDQTVVFAIGNTTAFSIKEFCSNPVVISGQPDKESLLQTAIEYFEQIKI